MLSKSTCAVDRIRNVERDDAAIRWNCHFIGIGQLPITFAPPQVASCVAREPTAPRTPWTSTVDPLCTNPTSTSRDCTPGAVANSQSWPIKPKDRHWRIQPDERRAFSRALSCTLSCSTGSLVLQGKPEIIGPDATNQTHRSGLSGMLTAADWNGRMYQVRPCSPLHGFGCQCIRDRAVRRSGSNRDPCFANPSNWAVP